MLVFRRLLWLGANAGILLLRKSRYEFIEIMLQGSPRLFVLHGSPRLVHHGSPRLGNTIGPVLRVICRLGFTEIILHRNFIFPDLRIPKFWIINGLLLFGFPRPVVSNILTVPVGIVLGDLRHRISRLLFLEFTKLDVSRDARWMGIRT